MRLLASPSVRHLLVPKAIARFRQSHPEVRVGFEIPTLAERVVRIASHRADLALTTMAVDGPTVKATQIAKGRLRVITPKRPLGAKCLLKPADVMPYPLIGYGSATLYDMVVNRALSTVPKRVRFNAQVRFTPDACCLVQVGGGIAMVDDFVLIDNFWPNIRSRPLVPKITTRPHLLSSRIEPLSHVARSFVRDLTAMMPTATDPVMLD